MVEAETVKKYFIAHRKRIVICFYRDWATNWPKNYLKNDDAQKTNIVSENKYFNIFKGF